MLIPNQCNDAHDCSLGTADGWLKNRLPNILASSDFTSGKLAVVVTADGDGNTSGNKVLTGESELKPTIGQVGHMNFIHPFRIQILGAAELAYLRALTESELVSSIDRLFTAELVAVVVANGEAVPPRLAAPCYAHPNPPLIAGAPLLITRLTCKAFTPSPLTRISPHELSARLVAAPSAPAYRRLALIPPPSLALTLSGCLLPPPTHVSHAHTHRLWVPLPARALTSSSASTLALVSSSVSLCLSLFSLYVCLSFSLSLSVTFLVRSP